MNNRPLKYKKRSPKIKDAYSVRSLVPEITGVREDAPSYDSALKEVQRIIMTMRETTGGVDKNFKVIAEFKDGIVFLTKAFLPAGEYRFLYEKVRDSIMLTEKEQTQLTELYMQAAKLNDKTPYNEMLLERAEAELEFIEVMDDISSILQDCIESAESLEYHMTKLTLVKNLREQINQVVAAWKNDVENAQADEAILMRIIELGQEQGYPDDEILSVRIEELREKVLKEYGLDTDSLVRQFKQELESE